MGPFTLCKNFVEKVKIKINLDFLMTSLQTKNTLYLEYECSSAGSKLMMS